jgi:cell division protein FtsZ
MTIELVENDIAKANIRVIGVGGGGGNAVNNMIQSGMTGVDFVAVNTDAQDLERSLAPRRFQLGGQLTKGLGAGADPEVGREAALEDRDRLAELVVGADMVFITAGMGGGTGTGAAPVIAQVAKEIGALTVACVTRPFHFEGRRRRKQAEEGIESLRSCVDTLITIPNQRLISMATERTTMAEAFGMADKVLYEAVKGVSDLIHYQGNVNVDFADVRTIMANKGMALMGVGFGTGEHRTVEAAQRAISSPLLDDVSIAGATSVLINVTGSSDLTMFEITEASTMIQEEAHEDANVIWGWVVDDTMGEEARVTVIATGFDEAFLQATPSVERRVAEAMRGGRMVANGGNGAGYRAPAGGNGMVSGVGTLGDYDIPTFFKNAD